VRLVLDASVIVKWLVADPEREADVDKALALMGKVRTGEVSLIQPIHWLAEVASVLARLNPGTVEEDIEFLHEMELDVADSLTIQRRACRLAIGLKHHFFDTLYHAVALETEEAMLVTADRRYLKKARRLGRIVDLAEWQAAS
jgi:predicted nucleic acid-binding protein